MPKQSKSGNKNKSSNSFQLRLRIEEDEEQYAEVLKPLGNGQFQVQILNGPIDTAKLKGSMMGSRKFDKVVTGNLVLIQLDGCTTGKDKYYIFHKYTDSERKQLEKLGELKSVVETTTSAYIFEGEDEEMETKQQEVDEDFIKGL